MVIGALLLILLLVLVLPFLVRWLEENLEIFFFVMGLAAVSVSGALNKEIILIALKDPIKITLAVFSPPCPICCGIIIRASCKRFTKSCPYP